MALFQTLEKNVSLIHLDADKITDACNTFLNITSADIMNINENIPACGFFSVKIVLYSVTYSI